MVVRCNATVEFPGTSSEQKLVMILCPQNVVGKNMKDAQGNEVNPSYCLSSHENPERYLCAMVLSGGLADSYEVSVWSQIVVDVGSMEAEVSLEYDPATRYYHIC
jgi:kinesin family protein 2/24